MHVILFKTSSKFYCHNLSLFQLQDKFSLLQAVFRTCIEWGRVNPGTGMKIIGMRSSSIAEGSANRRGRTRFSRRAETRKKISPKFLNIRDIKLRMRKHSTALRWYKMFAHWFYRSILGEERIRPLSQEERRSATILLQ